jgi:hypothetical protein
MVGIESKHLATISIGARPKSSAVCGIESAEVTCCFPLSCAQGQRSA